MIRSFHSSKSAFLTIFYAFFTVCIFPTHLLGASNDSKHTVVLMGDWMLGDSFWLKDRYTYLEDELEAMNYSVVSYLVNDSGVNDVLNGKKQEKFHYNQMPNDLKGGSSNVYPLVLFEKNHHSTPNTTVVISAGISDIYDTGKNKELTIKRMKELEASYKAIIQKTKEANPKANVVLVMPCFPKPKMFRDYFISMQDFVEIYQTLFSTFSRVAEQSNCQVIDLSTTLNPHNKQDYKVYSCTNPSSISAEYIAKLLQRAINDGNYAKNKSYVYAGKPDNLKVTVNDEKARNEYQVLLEKNLQDNFYREIATGEYASPFIQACIKGNLEEVKKWIEDMAAVSGKQKRLGVLVAIRNNHSAIACYLLQQVDNKWQSEEVGFLTEQAADFMMVEKLLDILFNDISQEHKKFLEDLVESYSYLAPYMWEIGFLHENQKELERIIHILKWVIDNGKMKVKSEEATRIFLITCEYGKKQKKQKSQDYLGLLTSLLDKSISLTSTDYRKRNSIMLAAIGGNNEIIDLLMKHIPNHKAQIDLLNAKDKNGRNALDLAKKAGNQQTVQLLEKYLDDLGQNNSKSDEDSLQLIDEGSQSNKNTLDSTKQKKNEKTVQLLGAYLDDLGQNNNKSDEDSFQFIDEESQNDKNRLDSTKQKKNEEIVQLSMKYLRNQYVKINKWDIPFGIKVLAVLLILVGAISSTIYWGRKNPKKINPKLQV